MSTFTPPSTICPRLTQAQARTLSNLKRNGNNVVGYESTTGPFENDKCVVFVTTRKEFHVREDGHILSDDEASSLLPASSASGRRRSLRKTAEMTEE